MALGNHSNIAGGNDIVAIGNNITVTRTGDDNNKNSNLVILGNNAKANDSKIQLLWVINLKHMLMNLL